MMRIEITRAEYEAMYGIASDSTSIGACLYAGDGKSIIVEYLFAEPQQEIEILEDLMKEAYGR
jgi:hypothetical protein